MSGLLESIGKEEKEYFERVRNLVKEFEYDIILNKKDYGKGSNAELMIDPKSKEIHLIINTKCRDVKYSFVHELKHIEYNFTYNLAVTMKSGERYILILCRILNNLHHHLLLEQEIDKEFKYNRLNMLKAFDENFRNSTKMMNSLPKVNQKKESTIEYLGIIIDSKIRRVNYENALTYHNTNDEKLDDIANEIVTMRRNLNIHDLDETRDFFLSVVSIIQREMNERFGESIIYKRKIEITNEL